MILTSVRAQHQNLGDLVIRRNMLHWLTGFPGVYVRTEGMPDDFVEGLQLPDEFIRIDAGLSATVRAVLSTPRVSLVYPPGEQTLSTDPRVLLSTIFGLTSTAAARATGGRVVRLARGYQGDAKIGRLFEACSARLSNLVLVRDARAMSWLPRASIVPDIGFWGGVSSYCRTQPPSAPSSQRNGVALTMRGDRPLNELSILGTLERLRPVTGSTLVVPTQVRFDAASNAAVARLGGGELLSWNGSSSHQLAVVESAYDQVQVVVSDRLHVLIFGILRGAVPLGIETGTHDKLRRQLEPVGLSDFVVPHGDVRALDNWIETVLPTASHRVPASLAAARENLDAARDQFRAVLGAGWASREGYPKRS